MKMIIEASGFQTLNIKEKTLEEIKIEVKEEVEKETKKQKEAK